MKKFLIINLLLLCSIFCAAQSSYVGWNKSFGASIGYSRAFGDFEHKINYPDYSEYEIPRNLVQFDLNICGLYVGAEYGYSDSYQYNDRFTVFGMKFGPSIAIGNYNFRTVITPFAGFQRLGYGEYYRNYWYDCYNRDIEMSTKFIAGAKVSFCVDQFEIGLHASNRDAGITIGFNTPLF